MMLLGGRYGIVTCGPARNASGSGTTEQASLMLARKRPDLRRQGTRIDLFPDQVVVGVGPTGEAPRNDESGRFAALAAFGAASAAFGCASVHPSRSAIVALARED